MKATNSFRVMLLALCAIMLGGLMTGCKEKNGPETPSSETPETPQEPGKAAFARAEAALTFTDAMLEVLDITIDYYDNAGELKSEAVTAREWKFQTKAPLPTKAGMCVRVAIKEGIDIDSYEKVNLTITVAYRCAAVDANDLIVGPVHRVDGASFGSELIGPHVQAWVNVINKKKSVSFLYNFDAEGNSEKEEWE